MVGTSHRANGESTTRGLVGAKNFAAVYLRYAIDSRYTLSYRGTRCWGIDFRPLLAKFEYRFDNLAVTGATAKHSAHGGNHVRFAGLFICNKKRGRGD